MMPEGPEVRTLVDQLQGGVGRRLVDIQFVSGRYVRNGKPDGFKEFAATMTPLSATAHEKDPTPIDRILSWKSKGKFIYITLDDGVTTRHNKPQGIVDPSDFQRSIWITLGMTGKFVSEKVHAQNDAYGRWYLEVLDLSTHERHKIHYHDIRNFGTLKFCLSQAELQAKLESLGPDILDPATTEDQFVEIYSKKKPTLNICKFLMNQANISGVGNYILAEGLYRAGLDPFASLQEIAETQQRLLFRELQSVAHTIWYTKKQLLMPLHERYHASSVASSRSRTTVGTSIRAPKRKATNQPTVLSSTTADTDTGWNQFATTATTSTDSRVEPLLSTLSEPNWKSIVFEAMVKDNTFRGLADFLAQEISTGQTVYPPHEDIFSALNLCPLDKVKVVIVGQDPYHGPGQANGLAFSVRKNIPPPPSLKNIFKEVVDDVGMDSPAHGSLEHWTRQGVLLLNTVLTVRQGDANSHRGKGWEQFTDFIIQHLNENREDLVFLLFGNHAQKKASRVDDTKHTLIKTSHPSPLGARKTSSPFLGSRCFTRCNDILMQQEGNDPIDWSVLESSP